MENLNLTTEDIIFLTSIVNDVINNGPIDNRVSVHEFVCLTRWQCWCVNVHVWGRCTYACILRVYICY